jgi:hypothetical protein
MTKALEIAMQTNGEYEKAEIQREMAKTGLDTMRRRIEGHIAPAPNAVELLKKAEECYANGDYVRALELAIQSNDELNKSKNG